MKRDRCQRKQLQRNVIDKNGYRELNEEEKTNSLQIGKSDLWLDFGKR